MFTLPIYDIGFFDLDIDFSPYIESTRKDLKYEVCSCGYLNLKENDYCYHCGVKRTHSKLRRIFKSQPKPTFSFTTVSCECGHVNSKENLFCEMCGKKLVEDEETPLKKIFTVISSLNVIILFFVFADRKMMNSVSFAVIADFR